jgi:hypothetical protein
MTRFLVVCESTFIDFNNLSDEDGNFSIGSNTFDVYEQETLVSQKPNETLMLVSRTSTSIVRSVLDLLKAMSQI